MDRYKPLILVKNRVFPTYQLYAVAENKKTDKTDIMKISILTVMRWIRTKFREREIPNEIKYPEPEDYTNFNLSDFKDFRIDEGYILTGIYLEDIKNWTFQLIEPDLGSEPGNENALRKPIAGRIFITNIAVRIINGEVEFGFETIVSEPESNTEKCEVYRLGIIKDLIRNPLVGLKHIWSIKENCYNINNFENMKSLKDLINNVERKIPVVLFSSILKEKICDKSETIALEDIKKSVESLNYSKGIGSSKELYSNFSINKTPTINENKNFEKFKKEKEYELNKLREAELKKLKKYISNKNVNDNVEYEEIIPYDAEKIAESKVSYAHFVKLSYKKMDEFNKIFNLNLKQGDIAFFEPLCFGGENRVFKYEKKSTNIELEINDIVNNYPVKKDVSFGNVLFVSDARVHQKEIIINSEMSIKEVIINSKQASELLKESYEEKLKKLREEKNSLELKKVALNTELRKKDEEIERINRDVDEKLENERLKRIINFKESLKKRPKTPLEIPDWVNEKFKDRMIFHERAIKEICRVQPQDIDMNLLCDALEFLATEYWENKLNKLSKEDMNIICSEKYERPFDVVPNGEYTLKTITKEYKVKYKSEDSTSKERYLDMHLRVGVDVERLIRIYFFFDGIKKLVVVGSLPKHLQTVTKF